MFFAICVTQILNEGPLTSMGQDCNQLFVLICCADPAIVTNETGIFGIILIENPVKGLKSLLPCYYKFLQFYTILQIVEQ